MTPQKAYEDFDLLEGVLIVDPEPENGSKRLTLWLKVEEYDDDGHVTNSYVVRAMCENKVIKSVLPNLNKELIQVRQLGGKVILLGNHWSGPWNEKLHGVDFIVAIVGFNNPRVDEKKELIYVTYGTHMRDALSSASYGQLLKKVGRFAIDKAL